jgi:hypothetical protein
MKIKYVSVKWWAVDFRKYSMTSRPTRLKESGTMNPPKPSYDCAFVA